ncbi:hypothetical protein BSL78_08743 [Apostichopus japonicus]|uniref:Phosphatidylethanolamine N-methyltransferase n=1 Tax=Stichopus japonicus TaxID=307972 RepID=A0A2G8L283_STIJA|nr:hypothetical protein BSL78_08743 [Apostichopus japonicus]
MALFGIPQCLCLKGLSALIRFLPVLFVSLQVARQEHKKRFLTNLFGSAKAGCIFLAIAIVHLMLFRSRRFQLVLESQPVLSDCLPIVSSSFVDWLGFGLIALGLILVITSFFALGFFGTYLGDYFGILMEAKVTCFPFNVTAHPMYYGSFLENFGTAIWYRSPAGVVLSFLLLCTYLVAIRFEEPFTAEIYRQKQLEDSKKSR